MAYSYCTRKNEFAPEPKLGGGMSATDAGWDAAADEGFTDWGVGKASKFSGLWIYGAKSDHDRCEDGAREGSWSG
jgi:hypothetical protein